MRKPAEDGIVQNPGRFECHSVALTRGSVAWCDDPFERQSRSRSGVRGELARNSRVDCNAEERAGGEMPCGGIVWREDYVLRTEGIVPRRNGRKDKGGNGRRNDSSVRR